LIEKREMSSATKRALDAAEDETALSLADDALAVDAEGGADTGKKLKGPVVDTTALRPKKPATGWMIFLSEVREGISKEHPGSSAPDIARRAGELYRNLPGPEKERLEALAKQAKLKYDQEMEEYRQATAAASSSAAAAGIAQGTRGRSGTKDTPLEAVGKAEITVPLARVHRTMKMDTEVDKVHTHLHTYSIYTHTHTLTHTHTHTRTHTHSQVSKDATLLIAKAMELFVAHMTLQGGQAAYERNARSITDSDILRVIHTQPALEFLRLDFPRVPPRSAKAKASTASASSSAGDGGKRAGSAKGGGGAGVQVVTGAGAISSFFAPTQRKAAGEGVEAEPRGEGAEGGQD